MSTCSAVDDGVGVRGVRHVCVGLPRRRCGIGNVRPGNILRPDPGRVYDAILWSLAQYPRWYAARPLGWPPLCFVQASQIDRIDGGISQVVAALLQVLWDANAGDARPGPVGYARLGPAMNLASLGVRIPLRGAYRIHKNNVGRSLPTRKAYTRFACQIRQVV